MKALISPFFGKFVAEDIKDHFSSDANVYIGIGRSLEFGSSVSDVDPVVGWKRSDHSNDHGATR